MNVSAQQLSGWMPIRLYWEQRQPRVDWCWVGTRRFTEPFFDHTIDLCLRLPFANLCRPQTSIDLLRERHALNPGVEVRGLIFHMSRCGSTLLSQMLAAIERNVVISEAGTIDSVLRARYRDPSLSDRERSDWLRWTLSALGQRRNGDEEKLFIKFDSWCVLDFSLIRDTFPGVPWVFLYRDPIGVLTSQFSNRGAHMVPGAIEPQLFGLGAEEVFEIPPEEYCARILAKICEAAIDAHQSAPGLLINYNQLPEAGWTTVAEFFGIQLSDTDLDKVKSAATRDAKNPSLAFEDDSKAKKIKVSEALAAASKTWLSPIYERLEATRLRTAAS